MTAATGDLLLLALLLATVGTVAFRASFVFLFGRLDEVPPTVERALRFVPAAVLAALVAPALAFSGDVLALSVDNHRLVAGLLAAVVAWRTESMGATLVVGMGALWTLEFLV